ncbi:MAG: nickel pincer cofactor-dependent isomerase, group 22 [Syntrophales bacterium]
MNYPKWICVRQNLDRNRVGDPYRATAGQLSLLPEGLIRRGARIAVTAGSRCIANVVPITRAVIDYIAAKGGEPFLVPAMGSHGGATSQGQTQVLAEFGLTAEVLGVPLRSSLEVVQLGVVENIPVYIDRHAHEADGIVIVNRIKAHQVFKGAIQSGLNKMLVVGLGKQKGADAVHASGRTDVLGPLGDFLRGAAPVLFGVAILENSYDETRDVAALTPDRFTEYDVAWAKLSRSLMPRIPIRRLDLVVVERMGKDVSGSGMDTNVIGFTRRLLATGQTAVPLAVLALTAKTEGNAMGIGLADLTTRQLVEGIDRQKTYTNVVATGIYSTGRIPVTLENERAILDTVLGKLDEPERARIVRIRNTLDLDRFWATEALREELRGQPELEIAGEAVETRFDERGYLAIDAEG